MFQHRNGSRLSVKLSLRAYGLLSRKTDELDGYVREGDYILLNSVNSTEMQSYTDDSIQYSLSFLEQLE